MQRALESALAELVFGDAIPATDAGAIQAWLARHEVPEDDRRAITEHGIERLLVYRSLVRGTLEEALEGSIPRTIGRLGALYPEYFARFLRERGPRTHYLRDATTEFLDFCAPLWAADARVAPYLIELGRHEALHILIAAAPPADAGPAPAPLELQSGLAFIEAARLVHYRHAVHLLADDVSDCTLPEPRETYLFVYRAPDHGVRYLALSPLAYAILSRLMDGYSLEDSLFSAATEHDSAVDDALLEGAARVLSDLSEREALLGPCRAERSKSGTPGARVNG